MPPEESTPPLEELAEVGRYRRFSAAQERGLVAAAMDQAYWVVRDGPEFVLYVEPGAMELIREELEKFEEESAQRVEEKRRVAETSLPKVDTLPLFVGAWLLSTCWAVQNLAPPWCVDRGDAENRAILAGEWWRTVTALTLHADLPHFVANLCFGLMFIGFLLPRFGGGLAWLGFALAGALGNAINAAFYWRELHSTIGASTAVFGALGMLVAWEFHERWSSHDKRGWWHLVVPLGGGLALLAYLGVGDGSDHKVDYMAHFWGFAAGFVLGFAWTLARIRERGTSIGWLAAILAVLLPIAAWTLALR